MQIATHTTTEPTTSVTTMFAPAELDWFRHTPARKDAPVLVAIADERPTAPSRERTWWQGLLDDLA